MENCESAWNWVTWSKKKNIGETCDLLNHSENYKIKKIRMQCTYAIQLFSSWKEVQTDEISLLSLRSEKIIKIAHRNCVRDGISIVIAVLYAPKDILRNDPTENILGVVRIILSPARQIFVRERQKNGPPPLSFLKFIKS